MNPTREKILSHWNEDQDTCSEPVKKSQGWASIEETAFPYDHGRPLPKDLAEKAIKYIKAIVAKYPFQLGYAMALPLWHRFAQEWCDTGDDKKALRAI